MDTRPGKFVTFLPEGEACVGIVSMQDHIFVATDRGVYHLTQKEGEPTLEPIRFEVPE